MNLQDIEPVAWLTSDGRMLLFADAAVKADGVTPLYQGMTPLYAHPPAPQQADRAVADKLAEALRDALENGECGDWQSARDGIRAALAAYEQEVAQ